MSNDNTNINPKTLTTLARYSYVFGDARLFKQYSFRLYGFYLRKISFISVDFV